MNAEKSFNHTMQHDSGANRLNVVHDPLDGLLFFYGKGETEASLVRRKRRLWAVLDRCNIRR